jgi:2'-5' RNA ligase
VRLFVGCAIGTAVADAAVALSGELQARAARLAPQARLIWTPRERLHVTLRFIGAVHEARVGALCEVLRGPLRSPAFDVAFEGVGVFPDRRPPRVIWAGVRAGTREMQAAARELNGRLAPLVGDDPEALRPHLTLARVKEPQGLRAQALLAGLETLPLGVTRVEAVTLFESRHGRGGLQYLPLMKTALEGG